MISLVVLTAATAVAYVLLKDDQRQIVDTTIFKVEDLTRIDQVILTKGENKIDLRFDGSRWKVNNQLADRSMIDVLFATLQQAEPKRPVAESIQDSIGRVLVNEGVKVSLYEQGEVRKEFSAGGNAAKTQAYFRSEEGEAYVIVIPGYRVYAAGIFELDEGGWKDKYVFNFNWRNFQTLKASFPASPENNFEVAMGKNYFEVKGIATADTTKLNDFLDAVSLLTVNQYVDKNSINGYDSLVRTLPIIDLAISDVSGATYTLALYKPVDENGLLGLIGGTQLAFFNERSVAAILKNKSWFTKK